MLSAHIHRSGLQNREAAIDLKTYIRPPTNLEMDPPCSFTVPRLNGEAGGSTSPDLSNGIRRRPKTIIELGAVSPNTVGLVDLGLCVHREREQQGSLPPPIWTHNQATLWS